MNTAPVMQPSPHVAAAEMEGEAILLNVSSGIYFSLNPVATRIWQLIGRGSAADDIVRVLLEEYDVDEARLRSDVDDTIRQLSADGLIDVVRSV